MSHVVHLSTGAYRARKITINVKGLKNGRTVARQMKQSI